MNRTIRDVEGQAESSEGLCEALRELLDLPQDYRPLVKLRGKSRKKRVDASFEGCWSPATDSIEIRFQKTSGEVRSAVQPAAEQMQAVPRKAARTQAPAEPAPRFAQTASSTQGKLSSFQEGSPLADLIRALDRAESRPGYNFVALKWFRDAALPAEGFSWATDDSARQAILRDAIDKRLILTSKLPNPRSPQFPVTAIRLNRLMPDVRRALGSPDASPSDSDFEPIPIRGELLSQTVLRDRR